MDIGLEFHKRVYMGLEFNGDGRSKDRYDSAPPFLDVCSYEALFAVYNRHQTVTTVMDVWDALAAVAAIAITLAFISAAVRSSS